MRQHVPPSQLWNEFHGDLEFEYDHEAYWPAMLKLCEEKSREQRERWKKAGKHIGESESYIKGGNVPSLFVGTNVPKQGVKEEVVKGEEEEKPSVPVQTNGTQANGNMDIVAVTEDPVITTEGDRS